MHYYFQDNQAVVENGILKSIKLNSLVVIPEGTEIILGEKAKGDLAKAKYGDDIFYSSLNQNSVLKTVVLPDNSVKIIGEKAFEHCHQLTNINIPDGVEEIRLSAFLCCYKLHSIELPSSIKLLDEWCFDYIDNLIVNYKGTIEQWNHIKKNPHWAKKGTLINTIDGELVL